MVSNSADAIPGKMFIGGLSMNTTQESLRRYFEAFGEVTDCALMVDRVTGKSRGFGFVTYKDPRCVNKVLAAKPHMLDGKSIDCKEAIPKSADPNDTSKTPADYRTKKIFVGGLPHDLTEEQFAEYFSNYGTVVHCQIMKDRETNKSRGFGFVTFDTEDAVEKVLVNIKEHKLLDKWVECKKATPTKPIAPHAPAPPVHAARGNVAPPGYGMPKYGYQGPPQDYYAPPHGYPPRAPVGGGYHKYSSNPFVADMSTGGGYGHQQSYYPPRGSYEQYGQPPKMDFSQYQQEIHAPQPPMYPPPSRYPSSSSYQSSYYDPRNYSSTAESRAYDPTQLPLSAAYSEPSPPQPSYGGFPKEPENSKIQPGQFNYARGFSHPVYSGFYSEPSYGESAGAAPGESTEGGFMMPGYGAPGEKKDFKEEPYSAQAFSQGLGFGIFPKPEEDGAETRPYGGGASYKPY